jgi:hypothetical protein
VIIVLSSLSVIPAAQQYNPISLAGAVVGLLNAQQEVADFLPALIICAVATVVLIAGAIIVFNKKRM